MTVKAILFDFHDTIAHVEDKLTSEEASDFLQHHGYETYPQSWEAASHYVLMIDYPAHGYTSRQAFIRQVLRRLNVKVDSQTTLQLAKLQEQRDTYSLFPDVTTTITHAKRLNMRTAIVTTIPDYVVNKAVASIKTSFDVIMTGRKAGCEKSNPLMHKKTLAELAVPAEQAVMIGDELLVDVKIPKRLGMHTILLDRYANKTKPPEADEKVANLTEAMTIIEKWHG
jgi:FMN phosphatase YigB (HAD superfamily)